MKAKKNVSYFPVSTAEQAILLRVREADLADRTDDLLAMLDQVAEARLTPAELDQAVQLLAESRQGEGLDARFDNLEARLKERIERGLAEIEGRLSKRLGGVVEAAEPVPTPVPEMEPRVDTPKTPEDNGGVPKEASVAFRVGSDLVWGESAAQFYVAVWRWLFEHGHVSKADLPIQSGKARYVVAAKPIHPTGKEFFAGHELSPGVWVEAHISRADIIRRAKKHLGQFGVAFEVVVGGE